MLDVQRNVPLSELPDIEQDFLDWQLKLPQYVATDEIGLRLRALGRTARWGGLKSVTVVEEAGPTTQAIPSIIGSDERGNALAGMSGAIKRESLSRTTVPQSNFWPELSWSDARIGINTNEIRQLINENLKKWPTGERSTQAWSHYLDLSIREGLASAGREQLVNNVHWYFKLLHAGGDVLTAASMIAGGQPVKSLGAYVVGGVTSMTLTGHYVRRIGGTDEKIRVSLLPFVHLDRLGILSGLTKSTKLIRAIKPAEG